MYPRTVLEFDACFNVGYGIINFAERGAVSD